MYYSQHIRLSIFIDLSIQLVNFYWFYRILSIEHARYQYKVTGSLTAIHSLGHRVNNCKMAYCSGSLAADSWLPGDSEVLNLFTTGFRQDFRTAPYINYAYSLCWKETKGITIENLWDYFALFLKDFIFSFQVHMDFVKIFVFWVKNMENPTNLLKFWRFLRVFNLPAF